MPLEEWENAIAEDVSTPFLTLSGKLTIQYPVVQQQSAISFSPAAKFFCRLVKGLVLRSTTATAKPMVNKSEVTKLLGHCSH